MGRFDGARAAALGLAAGLIGLGVLTLVFGDYALVWQPVPKAWPAHDAGAVVSGVILLTAGGLILAQRAVWGGLLAAVFIGLWVLALHLPHAFARPTVVQSWQAVAESTAMALGAFVASRQATGAVPRWPLYVMGVCYVVFGVAHFAYADFTTAMVPSFLPFRPQLTYLTGAVHALTGLALLIGLSRRLAAGVEALMMSSFVLLVHIPRVAAHPADRMELTTLAIATILTSAAWALATSRAVEA